MTTRCPPKRSGPGRSPGGRYREPAAVATDAVLHPSRPLTLGDSTFGGRIGATSPVSFKAVEPGGSPQSNPRYRLAGIEGMRALAAFSIVVYHVWFYGAEGGQKVDLGPFTTAFGQLRTGVTLFFVLSGFLLYRPYVAAALRETRRPSTRSYFRNRALRILPAYWVILIAVAIMFERELWSAPQQLAANLFFAQNYVPSYLAGAGIVPAWSLAIEVVFYLALPLLGAAAIRFAVGHGIGRTTAAFLPVGLMVVLGIGSKVARHSMEGDLNAVWGYSFFTHADWFAAGMALAVLRVLWEDGELHLPRWWKPAALLGAFGFAVLGVALQSRGVLDFLEYQSVMAIGCGLLLAVVVLAEPGFLFVRFLAWKPVLAAGLASYSLFLWHDPFVRGFREAGLTLDGRLGFLFNLLLISLVSGVAATLTYRFVEKPALARKRASFRAEEPAPEAAGLGSIERSDLKPAQAAVSTR
jgi:peptidoglycan/LPS O-acetylase OafA/YrhL